MKQGTKSRGGRPLASASSSASTATAEALTRSVRCGLSLAGRPDLQQDNLTLLMRGLPRRTRSLLESALGDRRQARRLGEKVALALQEGSSSSEWQLLADQFALDPAALCDMRPPIDEHCLVALNAGSAPSSIMASTMATALASTLASTMATALASTLASTPASTMASTPASALASTMASTPALEHPSVPRRDRMLVAGAAAADMNP